jgi:hypothetical protein
MSAVDHGILAYLHVPSLLTALFQKPEQNCSHARQASPACGPAGMPRPQSPWISAWPNIRGQAKYSMFVGHAGARGSDPNNQPDGESLMSKKHPIVAVTGSSGAGTTTVKRAFEHIFYRDGIKAAVIEGDSFHRYDRVEMKTEMAKASEEHRNLSHFGPEANRFDLLEELFATYGDTGGGKQRYYIHSRRGRRITTPGSARI